MTLLEGCYIKAQMILQNGLILIYVYIYTVYISYTEDKWRTHHAIRVESSWSEGVSDLRQMSESGGSLSRGAPRTDRQQGGAGGVSTCSYALLHGLVGHETIYMNKLSGC